MPPPPLRPVTRVLRQCSWRRAVRYCYVRRCRVCAFSGSSALHPGLQGAAARVEPTFTRVYDEYLYFSPSTRLDWGGVGWVTMVYGRTIGSPQSPGAAVREAVAAVKGAATATTEAATGGTPVEIWRGHSLCVRHSDGPPPNPVVFSQMLSPKLLSTEIATHGHPSAFAHIVPL